MFPNLARDHLMGELLGHRRPMRLAYVVLVVAAVATLILPQDAAAAVAALSIIGALGTAAWMLTLGTGSLESSERRAWRLLGIGLLLACLGVVVHLLAIVIATDVPTFGPIDLFWILGYGVGIAGIAALPHTAGSKWHRMRLFLDGLIGAVAASAILWTVTLRDITDQFAGSPLWERVIGSSYLVLDSLLLVVLVTVVIKRSSRRFDRRLVFIGAALTAQGIADYRYLISGLGRTFNDAEPIFALNIVAVTMLLATANNVLRIPPRREYADRITTPVWAVAFAHSLGAILFVSLLVRSPNVGADATDRSLLYATVALGVLVIARQGVTIREGRRLLDEHRSDLVASISHELRTPLTIVVGFLDLLKDGAFASDAERREVTSVAADQATHLSQIVTDLLALASDSATQIDLHVEPLAVDQLVACSIEMAAIDGAKVVVTGDQHLSAFVDKSRMEQALANLLANALSYGGEYAEVVVAANAGDLALEVHDDGPGVPRRYELIMWEKFERGPQRLNSAAPGSGNGLAITRAIAQAHGGSAGYRTSERLGGACFWVLLPGRVQAAGTTDQPGIGHLVAIPTDAQTA